VRQRPVYDSVMIDETAIRARYVAIKDQLNERGRRLFVAAEKLAAGYGGTAAVSRATGVAHSTIIRGAKDILTAPAASERVRRRGGGRRALSLSNPALLEDLRQLVEPATMGDPMHPLLWVSKSREKLASALRGLSYAVSANTVGKMLISLGIPVRSTARPKKVVVILTEMASSSTSTARFWCFRRPTSRSSRLIPRRKNLLASTRTVAAIIVRQAVPTR
jgi:hypothetical protein